MEEPRELDLRFVDATDPLRHVVPAAALARTLDGLQRLALLLGRRKNGQMPNRRFKPSQAEIERYRVVCELSQAGSFMQPVRIEGASLLGPQEAAAVTDQIHAILQAAEQGSIDEFDRVVDDETWQRFILDALDRMVPTPESGVTLEIKRGGRLLCSSPQLRDFAASASRRSRSRTERSAVIGTLKKIDFLGRQMTLLHKQSGRDLTCTYEEEIEASLVEHPREAILVFGVVTRAADGRPEAIDSADHIEAIDITPVRVDKVVTAQETLTPAMPLVAKVAFNEEDLIYEASIDDLRIFTFAETRDTLVTALEDEVAAAWEIYTSEPDASLTPAAAQLKQRLLAIFREGQNAA